MTVGKAIDMVNEMRPNHPYSLQLMQTWLRQADATLRVGVVQYSETQDFDKVGADVLWDEQAESLPHESVLICPAPYDEYYPHYICAQMDVGLGETERYANEMMLANSAAEGFARYCRRKYAAKCKGRMKT